MKAFLKILIGLVALLVLSTAALLIWFSTKGSEALLGFLTEQARQAGFHLEVEDHSLGVLPPRWIWRNTTLRQEDGGLEFSQDTLSLRTGWNLRGLWSSAPLVHMEVHMQAPRLMVYAGDEDDKPQPEPTPSAPAAPEVALPFNASVLFVVEEGQIHWQPEEGEAQSLHLDLRAELPSLQQSALRYMGSEPMNPEAPDLKGRVDLSVPIAGPVTSTLEAGVGDGVFRLLKVETHVMGMKAVTQGEVHLRTGVQDWKTRASSETFTEIPQGQLPVVLKEGSLLLTLEAQRSQEGQWQGRASFSAEDVRGDLNYENETLRASGPLTLNGSFEGGFTQEGLSPAPLQLRLTSSQLTATLKGVEDSETGGPAELSLEGRAHGIGLDKLSAKYLMRLQRARLQGSSLEGLSTQGTLNRGRLSGSATIQSLFDGQVRAPSYSVNLLSTPMQIQADLATDRVDLQKLTQWLAPEWKDSVQGRLKSSAKVQAPFPLPEGQALQALEASGEFTIAGFVMKSGRIDQMIREKLSSLASIGRQVQLKEQTVRAEVQGKVALTQGTMSLSDAKLETTSGDQIFAEGTITSDQQLNLKARAHLTDPPVRGTILAANSDPQGRLVVPVTLTGTLSSPSPQILETTLKTLLENAVKHEVRQHADKAKEDLQKTIEQEAKKLFEGLFN